VLGEPASVSALAARYDMSFAAVQKHVAVLEGARLVTKHRRGRERLERGDRARLESHGQPASASSMRHSPNRTRNRET
jgi:DNA-binding transcriptional ArsR family regulator